MLAARLRVRGLGDLRILGAALGGLFVVLVGLRLHGFSLPFWHELIDRSAAPEVLLGQARYRRWDDFAVQIPLALAQRAHEPAFPVVNTNIGLGQNMLVPHSLPVAHVVTLFRPTTWGFFLGGDVGVAWLWWSQVLGLLAVWTLVLSRLASAPAGLSALGGALLLASPVFQFWSFNCAPVAIYAGLCALSSLALASARSAARILLAGAGLGWSAASFLLTLYPPYQVALGSLVILALAGALIDRRRELALFARWPVRAGALALAAGIVALALGALLRDAGDAIEILRHTEYPGARVSTGGDRPFWRLLTADLGLAAFLGDGDWRALGNICEAAAHWIVWPVLAAGFLVRWWSTRARPDALSLSLLAYCGLVSLHAHLGEPEWVARVTGLGFMPGQRGVLGLALAETLLVVRWSSSERGPPGSRAARVLHASIALAWALALLAAGSRLRAALPALPWTWIALASALNGGLAFLLLAYWRPRILLGTAAVALAATSLWFNPLVRGGTGYLRTNELCTAVLRADRDRGGESTWIVYGASLGNLLPSLGVHALNGEQALPQLELWRRLDGSREAFETYNRYAIVHFRWPAPQPGQRISLGNQSNFTFYVDPAGPILPSLGATHVLACPHPSMPRTFRRFVPLAQVGDHALFELPLVRKSDPDAAAAPEEGPR